MKQTSSWMTRLAASIRSAAEHPHAEMLHMVVKRGGNVNPVSRPYGI